MNQDTDRTARRGADPVFVVHSFGIRLAVAAFTGTLVYAFTFAIVSLFAMQFIGTVIIFTSVVFVFLPPIAGCLASPLVFHLTTPRPAGLEHEHAYRIQRLSQRAATVLSVAVYGAVLVATPIVIESISHSVWRHEFIELFGGSETLGLIVGMFLTLLVPYMVARPCFQIFRWKLVRSVVPLCPSCLYELSGNESGVCPECGSQIDRPKRIDADV